MRAKIPIARTIREDAPDASNRSPRDRVKGTNLTAIRIPMSVENIAIATLGTAGM
jgi:hypothetical protein